MKIIYNAQVDKVEEPEPEPDEDELARTMHPAKHRRVERNVAKPVEEVKEEEEQGEEDEGKEEEEGAYDGAVPTDEVAKSLGLPVSHEVVLEEHNKGVLAVALEPKGIRLVTGGADYHMKMFDFNGMTK